MGNHNINPHQKPTTIGLGKKSHSQFYATYADTWYAKLVQLIGNTFFSVDRNTNILTFNSILFWRSEWQRANHARIYFQYSCFCILFYVFHKSSSSRMLIRFNQFYGLRVTVKPAISADLNVIHVVQWNSYEGQ